MHVNVRSGLHRVLGTRFRRVLATLAVAMIAITGITVATPQKALANYPTYCWSTKATMWHGNVYAQVTVPYCFNGYNVWPNGNVTPGGGGIGVSVSIGWAGTYNSSSRTWLGFGENMTISNWFATYTCAPRWYINTDGQFYNGNMNC